MAVSAREVLMIFRGQNYLSSAIRKVGRDVGSLSRGTQLANQRQQMQIVQQRLRQTRQLDAAELKSITTGVRRQALTRAQLANTRALAAAETGVVAARNREAANRTRTMEAEVRANRLNRLAVAGRPLSGHTLQETNRLAQAASQRVSQLGEMQSILAQRTAIATRSLSANALEAQQLIEKDAALAERQAFLTQRINNTSRALDLQAVKLQENALQARMLPVERWRDYARQVEHTGRVLQMVGGFATLAVAISAHAAANLNTQAVLAATQARPPGAPVGRTAQIATQVSAQAINLIRRFPASAADNLDAFYQVFSGTNIQGVKQAASELKTFNMMAVAGGTDLATMVQAGITMHNVFPGEFRNSTQAANVFFAAVRYGRLNADQLAQSLGYVAPIAKDVGLNFRNLAGDIAFATRQTGGRMTRQDAQGLARLYQLFARTDVTQGLAAKGIAVFDKATGKMRPLINIVEDIRKRMHLTNQETINFFKNISAAGSGKSGTQGTIQALRIFSLMVGGAKQYRNVVNLVNRDNDEFIKSFEAMSKTPGVRWKVFVNQLKALAYTVGTQAIPVLIKLSAPIQSAVHWFENLSPHTQKFIATFITLASVGTLLVGTFAAIAGGIASFALTIYMVLKFRGALAALAGEAGAITTSGALGLGLLVVIPLMIKYHAQVNAVVQALGGWKTVMTVLAIAVSAFTLARTITSMMTLTSEAGLAATAVSRVRLSLLAINGFVAVATLLYVIKRRGGGISDPFNLPKDFKDRVDADLNKAQNFVTKYSGAHAIGRFLHFPGGFGHYAETKTPAEQQAQASNNAIKQAIADSPRYQHVINANAAAINRQYKALEKQADEQARINALDKAAGITKHVANLGQTAKQWIDRVNAARAVMLGDPKDISKAQAYERIVNQLNARFKNQPVLLSAINDVLNSYNDDLDTAAKKTKTLGVTTQDVLSSIQSMYDNFKSQETTAFGALFQGPYVNSPAVQNRLQYGGMLSGQDLFKDLKSQITQFQQFHRRLDDLRRRGAPAELIKQLTEAGPSALPQIKALDQLGPKQLRDYYNTFNRGQKLIQQQTMRDLNAQLTQYRKHGQQVALAIIAGIRSEDTGMEKVLQNMIKKMFPGLPTGATGAGGRATHRAQSTNKTQEIHHHTEIHVVAPKKDQMSVKAQIRHADLARRNRYTGRGPGPR